MGIAIIFWKLSLSTQTYKHHIFNQTTWRPSVTLAEKGNCGLLYYSVLLKKLFILTWESLLYRFGILFVLTEIIYTLCLHFRHLKLKVLKLLKQFYKLSKILFQNLRKFIDLRKLHLVLRKDLIQLNSNTLLKKKMPLKFLVFSLLCKI